MHHGSVRRVFRDLPGEGAVDRGLVDTVAGRLRQVKTSGELAVALQVGRLLLDAFFTRDAHVVTEDEVVSACRGGRPHASWRALILSDATGWSGASLYRFVRLARQHPLLPVAAQEGLTLTHQRELLGVPHLPTRRRLATRAVRDGWSTRRLAQEVGRWRARFIEVPIGRPPLDPLERATKDLERSLGRLEAMVGERGGVVAGRGALIAKLRSLGKRAHECAERLDTTEDVREKQGGRKRPMILANCPPVRLRPRLFPRGNRVRDLALT